jgi:hypothetical protein
MLDSATSIFLAANSGDNTDVHTCVDCCNLLDTIYVLNKQS